MISHFFSIFENLQVSADQVYFLEFNSKKSAILAECPRVARAAKFSFSKSCRDLKNEFFFLKICRILPNTSKNNRQK